MTTNKKIVITFSSICAALIISLVAIVAVFASSQGSVSSNIIVHYTASDIVANVSANIINSTGESTAMTVGGEEDGQTLIEFKASTTNEEAVGNLSPSAPIEIETSSKYVVFEFVFENGSSTYCLNVDTADGYPTFSGASSRFTIKYYSGAQITDGSYLETITEDNVSQLIVAGLGVGYIYVLVRVSDIINTSTMDLDFSWLLTQGERYSE